jgi:hypothetical protein
MQEHVDDNLENLGKKRSKSLSATNEQAGDSNLNLNLALVNRLVTADDIVHVIVTYCKVMTSLCPHAVAESSFEFNCHCYSQALCTIQAIDMEVHLICTAPACYLVFPSHQPGVYSEILYTLSHVAPHEQPRLVVWLSQWEHSLPLPFDLAINPSMCKLNIHTHTIPLCPSRTTKAHCLVVSVGAFVAPPFRLGDVHSISVCCPSLVKLLSLPGHGLKI